MAKEFLFPLFQLQYVSTDRQPFTSVPAAIICALCIAVIVWPPPVCSSNGSFFSYHLKADGTHGMYDMPPKIPFFTGFKVGQARNNSPLLIIPATTTATMPEASAEPNTLQQVVNSEHKVCQYITMPILFLTILFILIWTQMIALSLYFYDVSMPLASS